MATLRWVLAQWLAGVLSDQETQVQIDAILGPGCYSIPAPEPE